MKGIFLHTGWRTAGTWLWDHLRAQPGYMGFYEPLHEALPKLTPEKIASLTPASWGSRHGAVAKPYFEEYLPLLRTGQRTGKTAGIRGCSIDFSFDRFFMAGSELHPALAGYVQSLCDMAGDAACAPVLKFTRSQGRLPWFREQFPDQIHALVTRQPWHQFRSAWRLLTEHNNPFFLAAPCLVLERNAAHPDVARLISHLDLPLRPGRRGGIAVGLRVWSHAVKTLPLRTLYRMHLGLWLLNMSHGLPAADFVVDGESDTGETAALFGAGFKFDHRGRVPAPAWTAAPAHNSPSISADDIRHTHARAMAALRHQLEGHNLSRIAAWLEAAESSSNRELRQRLVTVPAPSPTLSQRALGFLRAKPVRSL